VHAGRIDLRAVTDRLAAATSATSSPCIGVFDSGVGGLSVLDAIRQRLPDASLVYVGDVAYAPYGERVAADVLTRCERIVAQLVAFGARLIVVACNTATVLAIETLRRRWPTLHFVGVEPGVKPAVAMTCSGRIAVLATPATAASPRLRHLVEQFAPGVHVHIESCPGLAAAVERGAHGDSPALAALLAPSCRNVRAAEVDTVVLGCTHYPFVADAIRAQLGSGVRLVDTARAVAERVASVALEARCDHSGATPRLRVISTGASPAMTGLLRRCLHLEHAAFELLPI
jgi:glutamate racemase